MCIGRWSPVFLIIVAFWLSAGGALAQNDVTGDGQEYERVHEYIERGEFKAAIDLASEILQRAPNSAEALHLRAVARFLSSGDWEKSAADLDEVLRLDPKHFKANCNRSMVYFREGDQDAAIEYAERSGWPRTPLTDTSVGARLGSRKESILRRSMMPRERSNASRTRSRRISCAARRNSI